MNTHLVSNRQNGWRDLFLHGGLALAVFVGGIALQAVEGFIGSAMMPTVVRDIGGLDLFAWNATVFVVASIAATILAATRLGSAGPRAVYIIAAATFGVGGLVCGAAPTMLILLAGRALQGFGGGLLVATSFAMLRIVFPQRLWPRAMAMNSLVWGVATVLGPAIGGVFAQWGLWRWAFYIIAPLSALLAIGAARILPRQTADGGSGRAPLLQIALVIGAILAVSLSSLITAQPVIAALLAALAAAAIIALAAIERRAAVQLLPAGAFSPDAETGALFAMVLLLSLASTSTIFAPLFLQRLHGLSPLAAGYITALAAAGWTVAAIMSSGWQHKHAGRAIIAAPIVMLLATLASLPTIAQPGDSPLMLVGCALALFALGAGIGIAFQHLSTRILASASAVDNQRVSAALGMTQLFAGGLGAAIAGVAVNAAGLPQATNTAGVAIAATSLYVVFALIAAIGIPLGLRIAGRFPQTVFSQPPSTK